jgi:polyvinyl alcohol dehydrogenase (cytochrome)
MATVARRLAGTIGVTVAVAALLAGSGSGAGAAAGADWSAYEHGPAHSSAQFGDTAITTANAGSLHVRWHFVAGPATQPGAPGPRLDGSPVTVAGRVYIGSRTGIFYALNATTGAVVWQHQLDFGSSKACAAKGITGTATVAPDPVTGVMTVYAPGAHYLYALNAATGTQLWKRAIGPATAAGEAAYYLWSSPTVIGGRIVIGLGANCEQHTARGGVVEVDQHTGALLHTWYDAPSGQPGATVWSSQASDGTSVWATTGDPKTASIFDAYSIVRLSWSTLAKLDEFTVSAPATADLDFGSSPTLFTANLNGVTTNMVGACNKNGIYYAWKQASLATPVWQRQLGAVAAGDGGCITSAAYDGPNAKLFVAANQTTVSGKAVPGSVRALNPATGAVIWEKALSCLPDGSPTLNATTNVLAVPTYSCSGTVKPGVVLFNSQTGAQVGSLSAAGHVFAQPVFAEGMLLVASEAGDLTAYGP